jgi:hypothetical protein
VPIQSVGPGEDPGGGEGRQLEPRVEDERRLDDQENGRGPAERGRRPTRPSGLAGEEHDAGHRRGPHDRRRGAGEQHVADDRDDENRGSSSPADAARKGGDRRRDDRDVPARDRHDMARADGREVRRQIAIDPVAQPDHDPGGEARLRLRDRGGEGIAGPTPEPLERRARPGHRRLHRQRSRANRRRHVGPPEIVAIRPVWRRFERAVDRHDQAGLDLRIAGERRGDEPGPGAHAIRTGDDSEGRDLLAVAIGSTALDDRGPWPTTLRELVGRDRAGIDRARHEPEPDRQRTDRDGQRRPSALPRSPDRSRFRAGNRAGRERQRRRHDRDDRRPHPGRHEGRQDRPDREPAACAHGCISLGGRRRSLRRSVTGRRRGP